MTSTAAVAASEVVAALETTWAAIQARHGEVPTVMVTLGSGSLGAAPGAMNLGHYAAARWVSPADDGGHIVRAELFVAGEGLVLGAEQVLGTLLHEAAHGLATARGIKDTSRQGRYHNTRFKTLAQELGLTVKQVGAIGWSGTELPEASAAQYAEELEQLGAALRTWRRAEGALISAGGTGQDDADAGQGTDEDDQSDTSKPRNGRSLTCACPTPRRIRVAASVADLGAITCAVCAEAFTDRP